MAKYVVGIILIILLTGAGYYWYTNRDASGGKGQPISTASFQCEEGKTIQASFYQSSVDLTLSDGRTFTLPQAVSADGARYANPDEAVVFWNKGDTAFITEGGNPDNQTFKNCGIGGPVAPQANTFTDASSTFSVVYPTGWSPDASYAYTGVSAAKPIHGVKFQIPMEMATGTNLASDTYVAVEQLPRATSCTADIYIKENVKAATTDINGHSYSVASTTGAGAGNRYEEIVYALPGSKPCTAVRYWIHYGNIQNYPEGAVKEFDRASLMAAFDNIRDSVKMMEAAPAASSGTSTTPTSQ